jgi:hypothetical protein
MEKNTRQQDLIIRQSQLERAIEYCALLNKQPSLVDVIKITTMLEQFINKGYSKEMVELMEKVDSHIADLPDNKSVLKG